VRDLKRKYIQILKLELEDLEQDIEVLISDCLDRREKQGTSSYVFLENIALLKREVLGVERVSAMLDRFDLNQYATVAELVEALDRRFHELVSQHDLVEAVYHFLQRKLQKVARYVGEEYAPDGQ